MIDIKQGYDWQKFYEALASLVGDGSLSERLKYARQAIDLLAREGVSTTPKLLDKYQYIRDRLLVLDTLPMDKQEELAKDILSYFAKLHYPENHI